MNKFDLVIKTSIKAKKIQDKLKNDIFNKENLYIKSTILALNEILKNNEL